MSGMPWGRSWVAVLERAQNPGQPVLNPGTADNPGAAEREQGQDHSTPNRIASRSAIPVIRSAPRNSADPAQRLRTPTPATTSPMAMITGPATVQNVVSLIELPLIAPTPCRVNSRPANATNTPVMTNPGLRIVASLISRARRELSQRALHAGGDLVELPLTMTRFCGQPVHGDC